MANHSGALKWLWAFLSFVAGIISTALICFNLEERKARKEQKKEEMKAEASAWRTHSDEINREDVDIEKGLAKEASQATNEGDISVNHSSQS